MNSGSRLCTKSVPGVPLFFIGCSPSQASKILSPQNPAAGVMVSVNQLRNRISDFHCGDWLLDSGAFTEVSKYGGFRYDITEYYRQICRWSSCGNLLIAVSQDFMCEPFILQKTSLSILQHQSLTIERYDALLKLDPPVPVMPVLQGYRCSDYLHHLQQYGDRLRLGAWVGVGSVCKRNGNSDVIADLLRGIKLIRPDLRLHGFGLKVLALENAEVRSLLHSCDSMAWSFPLRFRQSADFVQNQEQLLAHQYQEKVVATANPRKRVPVKAGAGNGQGRKPQWQSPTTAIRIPEKYAQKLTEIAREWEKEESPQV